jgi:ABC-2 type transport system ATP-binding protein
MTADLEALRFAGVTKRYGGTPALEEFTLDIHHGETFGLVGENGAGKTTLIKTLLDFCECDAGSIEIFGRAHRITAARARLAFLPERFNPPFYLTGRDFLRYMCELHRVPYREADAQGILLRLDLAQAALEKTVRAYSKGMTQKLGLAACLLAQKDCYILDEPTSGLDPKARALLKQELRKLRTEGRTVFFTSHALADVSEICDRMAVLHNGKLLFAGTPGELAGRYGASNLEQAFLACISAPAPA